MSAAGEGAPVPHGALLAFAAPAAAVMVLFFLAPLATVFAEAFGEGGAAFGRLFRDPVFWRGLVGTLVLGGGAAAASTAAGLAVALALARMSPGARTALLFLIALPLTFSGLVIAFGFILLFGRAGFVTLLLAELGFDPAVVGGLIFTPLGLGVAYAYYLIPRAVMVLLPVVLDADQAQVAAARSLGASRLRAGWDVLLPQVMPGLVSAFCFCAAVAMGAYGTALALAGTQVNILPLVLYSKVSETGTDLPAAAAGAVVLLALCVGTVALAEGLAARRPARAAPPPA